MPLVLPMQSTESGVVSLIEIILTEEADEIINTNDLQWFQDAVLSAAGHSGNPFTVAISDNKISCFVPSGEE